MDPGPLEKVTRTGSYAVSISYSRRGEDQTHVVEPASLANYESWNTGESVVLSVRNMGAVAEVVRGR